MNPAVGLGRFTVYSCWGVYVVALEQTNVKYSVRLLIHRFISSKCKLNLHLSSNQLKTLSGELNQMLATLRYIKLSAESLSRLPVVFLNFPLHSGYPYSLTNAVQQLNTPLLHIMDSQSHCDKILLGWIASFLNVWPTYIPQFWFNTKDRRVHYEGNSVKLVYG